MSRLTAIILLFPLLVVGCAQTRGVGGAQQAGAPSATQGDSNGAIVIARSGSRPPQKGPAEYFTGTVRVDPLFTANDPSRTSGGLVTFEPGARSAWHTHPLGQTLIVTAGVGRVQRWGGPVEEIRTGDVVWIPPRLKHWHGASPTSGMTHLAIQESSNGKVVEWMEKVTNEQYAMATTPQSNARRAASTEVKQPNIERRRLSPDDVRAVAPALEQYTQGRLYGEVWKRPGLTPRDRSIVTIAAMIARGQTGALTYYFAQALDNGVKPAEISELITHLAFYSGRGNAMSAIAVTKDVFAKRAVRSDQLAQVSPKLLPLNETREADRAKRVGEQFGTVSPGVVQYTTEVLFLDLWLRPDLAPRERSLVTISSLIALGQGAQLTSNLNLAMDNGLTQAQASEALTHLAFYVGWPNVFSALPVAKDVFEKRK